MSITLADLDFLTSDAGQLLLARLAGEDLSDGNTLPLLTNLRKDYAPEQAAAALTIARLRLQGVTKFGVDAARMFFTDDALQQASDPLVRAYRAERVAESCVLDVGCGIGADSLAFSVAGKDVLGLDIDALRVAMARKNAAALGLSDRVRFEITDVRNGIPAGFDVIFYDPARRDSQGRRIHDVERSIPPLSLVLGWHAPLILVKLSPGVTLNQLHDSGGRMEFISASGDLKEALLWLGDGHTGRTATLLAGGEVFHWQESDRAAEAALSQPCEWLVEPDPALIRAGLVQDVALEFGGYLLDETIAYFTTDGQPDSPWVRTWKIMDWMPFNLKKLRAYLRERDIGQVTVKKRGSPLTPEELTAKLKLKGSESCTLVLTRFKGKPVVIICVDYGAVY
jgi:SAM-dependent methyltransferase